MRLSFILGYIYPNNGEDYVKINEDICDPSMVGHESFKLVVAYPKDLISGVGIESVLSGPKSEYSETSETAHLHSCVDCDRKLKPDASGFMFCPSCLNVSFDLYLLLKCYIKELGYYTKIKTLYDFCILYEKLPIFMLLMINKELRKRFPDGFSADFISELIFSIVTYGLYNLTLLHIFEESPGELADLIDVFSPTEFYMMSIQDQYKIIYQYNSIKDFSEVISENIKPNNFVFGRKGINLYISTPNVLKLPIYINISLLSAKNKISPKDIVTELGKFILNSCKTKNIPSCSFAKNICKQPCCSTCGSLEIKDKTCLRCNASNPS